MLKENIISVFKIKKDHNKNMRFSKIKQKIVHLNHDFYVVVGKQCRKQCVDGSPIQYLYILKIVLYIQLLSN